MRSAAIGGGFGGLLGAVLGVVLTMTASACEARAAEKEEMFHDIGKIAASAAQGATLNATLAQACVAGVLVIAERADTVGKVQLQLSLQTKGGSTEQIIPAMPLFPLVELADLDRGVGYGAHFEQAAEGDAATNTKRIAKVAAFIPIGQINLSAGDELHFNATVTSAFAATDGLRCAFVDLGRAPEYMLKYVLKQSTGNATFTNPERVALYRLSGDSDDKQLSALAAGDLNVTVKVGEDTKTYDALLAWGYAAAVGAIELGGPRRTCILMDDTRVANPGADVTVTLAGNEASNYGVFAIERHADPVRARRSQREHLQIMKARLEKLETGKPEVARAMRTAGLIAPSVRFGVALQKV